MKISVVTAVYCSENYLYEFYTRTKIALKLMLEDPLSEVTSSEIVFVNDGSPDNSLALLKKLQASDPDVVLINLSRNFGHHKAIYAGLEHAAGDYVFLIDCDLEESPELVLDFWQKLKTQRDIDVVYGVQNKRKGGFIEKVGGKLFYLFLDVFLTFKYPHDMLTARLMTRNYIDAILKYKEKSLDLWSVFAIAGYRQEPVFTNKLSKGSTTYTIGRKFNLAVETVTSSSNRPLYLIFLLGIITFIFSGIYLSYILYIAFTQQGVVEGWASTIASIWLVGGITFLLLGIIAIYLAKIFQEVKARPLYVVKEIIKAEEK